jgi:uncharacterized membrane protein affecting hemolysin expression
MRVTFTVTAMISSNMAVMIMMMMIIIIIIIHDIVLSSLLYGSETKRQRCNQNTALETDRKKYAQE